MTTYSRFQIPGFLLVPYPLVYGKTIPTQHWCKHPSEDAWMNGTSKCSCTSIFEQALVSLGNWKVAWPLVLLCGCTCHHQHHILPSTNFTFGCHKTHHPSKGGSSPQTKRLFIHACFVKKPSDCIDIPIQLHICLISILKKLVWASREFNQVMPNMPLDARILAIKDRKAQDVEIMRTLSMVP